MGRCEHGIMGIWEDKIRDMRDGGSIGQWDCGNMGK